MRFSLRQRPQLASTGALIGALLSVPALAHAQGETPPTAPASSDIDARVRELENTVRTLQETIRRLEAGREAPPRPATPAPGTPAPGTPASGTPAPRPAAGFQDGSGFFIQSADGDFRFRLRGYVQSDAQLFTNRSGDTGSSSFLVRRVRPILDGTLYRYVDFRIMPDFGSGATSIQDAFITLRYQPQAQIQAGKFKEPLSLERLQSDQELQFMERSIANNLAPNRDIGLMVFGDLSGGVVSYALGAFNGVVDGGSSDVDANDDKDLAARVFVQPFRNQANSALQGLGVGVAATTGRRSESVSGTALRTIGRSTFFRYDNAVVGNGHHTRWAPQAHLFTGPFGLMGEYIQSRQAVRKGTARDTLTNSSWFVQGSYVLTGERASFRSVVPARPFDPARGQFGAVELAARYARLNIDGDAFGPGAYADPTVSAQKADAWTLGVNWYLNRGTRAQLNYEHTDFHRSLTFGTATRDHEDSLLSRLQLAF